jgi:hypothetical protein
MIFLMKKIILLTIALIAFTVASCFLKDKCTRCQNGATCSDGTCVCTAAFEGDNCETPVANKFVGTWRGSINCSNVQSLRITWKEDLTVQCEAFSSTGAAIGTFYAVVAAYSSPGNASIAQQDVNGVRFEGYMSKQDAVSFIWRNGNCELFMVKK